MLEAVEHKLAEQRKFVLWWDGAALRKGGKPSQTADGLAVASQDGLPDRDTIHRWRRSYEDLQSRLSGPLEAAEPVTAAPRADTAQEVTRMPPKAFRTVLHGTCLLNGKHPPGSRLARECPVLRRAERLQARENNPRPRGAAAATERTR